ncbi:RNA-binding S4 domain-containing protein [Tindallia californiensis]|uniref:RQC P-site tRNA stabilizing factor n=1 Tax=Tindallia californiensis TaxID=159292 RepID=A0A1H3PFY3_9FIRM|nr:RNA-binding S4 domain-containing protein [Tindallia californiensis]SDY99987.1 Ribosomal 50S subunit-recycling heat shock protein, contains S4 domain [Tindallia californiensis]
MRLDKYLKNARIIKRRTIAKEACDKGLVTINGRDAKAGTEVQPGDHLTIAISQPPLHIQVLKVAEHVKKEEAESLYQMTPSPTSADS